LIALVSFPLFQGACIDLVQRSVINGLFSGATPFLVEHVTDQLAEENAEAAAADGR